MVLRDQFIKLFPYVRLLNLYSTSKRHNVACGGKLSVTQSSLALEINMV
jgi:hypothetical protein